MTTKIAKQEITYRPYQLTDIEAIENGFKEYRSILYQLPTGGGKGVIMTKLISDYKGEQQIVFAHKRKLLKQIHKNLANIGIKAGLMIAQKEENIDADILLVSIRTAVKSKRLEALVKRPWQRVYIDEARHSRTGSYDIVLDRLLEMHPTHKLFGVDATPYRKDKKRLDKHFQALITSCENIKTLQEKGFLAKIRTYATPIGEIEKTVKEVANDYQQTELSNYMRQPKYLNYVVDAYTKFGEGRQAIVFAVDKAHSKDLMQAFIDKGYDFVQQIDSDKTDAEIDKVYDDYENKLIQVLINVEMLTEGVDLPETGCIVGARPTKSVSLYLQMGGRGTRPKEDGSDLIVIDCAGWTEAFGSLSAPRAWSLDPDVDPNDPRKMNRIVGKTKEGKLTTELDEMDEFTELVEMTPEEYIQKVEGGLKAAAKQNLTIDEKVTKIEDELAELMHKVAIQGLKEKVSPFMGVVRQDEYDSEVLMCYFFHKSRFMKKVKRRRDSDDPDAQMEIDAWVDETHVVEMNLGKKELMYAGLSTQIVSNEYYRRNDRKESIKEFREMAQVCGSLNQQIMDNKNLLIQILEKHQEIHDLKKSKINLNLYKDLQKKHEADMWMQTVKDHLKTGKMFELSNKLRKDNYFKGYDSNRVLGITIPSGSIATYHNTIVLKLANHYNTEQQIDEERKYVKGEKVYEILKEGGWKSVQEIETSKN